VGRSIRTDPQVTPGQQDCVSDRPRDVGASAPPAGR
jgi:hypothetical protein